MIFIHLAKSRFSYGDIKRYNFGQKFHFSNDIKMKEFSLTLNKTQIGGKYFIKLII